jgi:SOS-response transcriptional repressor LexA
MSNHNGGKSHERTDRQALVLEYIKVYRRETGIPPTFREIAGHFGISYYAAYRTIELIRKKGELTREANKARSILTCLGML